MKLALAMAAMLGLSVSGASAECGGHLDRTAQTDAPKVATLDTTTTASTTAAGASIEQPAEETPETVAPAEAD